MTSLSRLMRQMKENFIAPRLEMDGLKFSFAFSKSLFAIIWIVSQFSEENQNSQQHVHVQCNPFPSCYANAIFCDLNKL